MVGKTQPHLNPKDFRDPFNAGQMVGMLVALTYLEENRVPQKMIDELKWVCAENAQVYLQKPTEDVFLLVNNIVKEME